ncbi:hypothetical protein J6590_051788 [Homalodisca vitripennis]|nr:hypothetical protein J6590_051788 [Homalodisca vitripennis]
MLKVNVPKIPAEYSWAYCVRLFIFTQSREGSLRRGGAKEGPVTRKNMVDRTVSINGTEISSVCRKSYRSRRDTLPPQLTHLCSPPQCTWSYMDLDLDPFTLPSLYILETVSFCMSKCTLIMGLDVHEYETRACFKFWFSSRMSTMVIFCFMNGSIFHASCHTVKATPFNATRLAVCTQTRSRL